MSEARALSRAAPPRAPTQADWSDALLTSGSEALIGAVRNYLGPVKTPYDKRELVRRLEAFLRREETRASLLGLLDGLDARILARASRSGPSPSPSSRSSSSASSPSSSSACGFPTSSTGSCCSATPRAAAASSR